MRERIESKTTSEACSRVAKRVSGVAMRYLMCDDRKDKDDEGKNSVHVCVCSTLCYHATTMARACEITGKSTQIGGRYSNRTRATQFNPTGTVRRKANLQRRRVYVAELGKTVIVDVSVKGLKTIKKNGAFAALKKVGAI